MNQRRTRIVAIVVIAALILAGGTLAFVSYLASRDGAAPAPAAGPAVVSAARVAGPAPAAVGEPAQCDDGNLATTSFAPAADTLTKPGAAVREIKARGRLVVGVSADTLLMGARNPISGRIEGFDIDMVRLVAKQLLGDEDAIQFRVITSAQRLDVLESHEVDLVARAFTMNCERWETIAFSAEYLHAGQKVLVTRDSPATGIADLGGARVCAPEGTTTIDRLAQFPDVTAVPSPTHTGCLVLFQQGKADAITGDDTILAGFAAQDPYAKVVGDAISDEPYGIGVAKDRPDLVRYVNAVLDRAKKDGTWAQRYERWLTPLGAAPEPPVSVYGR